MVAKSYSRSSGSSLAISVNQFTNGTIGHARGPHVRRLGHGHHGQIAAVAAAHDDQLLGIDEAALLDPLGGIEHVVQLAATGIAAIGVGELLAVAG